VADAAGTAGAVEGMGQTAGGTAEVTAELEVAAGRPTLRLPLRQLYQLSIYWFGINAIWGGINILLQERVPDLVGPGEAGRALALMDTFAVLIAIVVQPTVGSISDYTISRWGRRKPYIAIGSVLDLVFLIGIASGETYLSILAFLILLQFSSNFAQGPFQGYIPDLVPSSQVATASALVGVMSILGVVGGTLIISTGYGLGDFTVPTIMLGVVEVATAIGTILWVDEGRQPKPRNGRTWVGIARETWGLDVFAHRGFVAMVLSRLFVLAGIAVLTKLAVLYLERTLLMGPDERQFWVPATNALVALVILLSTWPAARLSDRIGRKPVIYGACALGAAGAALGAVAPGIAVAEVGVVLIATSAGAFLAVDWALMTEIIPKESAGRFMGMSNVATASAGPVALIIGGTLMDVVGGVEEGASGPRAAFAAAILFYALGALFLRPVPEPRPSPPSAPAAAEPTAPASSPV
jgi:MFS family permease